MNRDRDIVEALGGKWNDTYRCDEDNNNPDFCSDAGKLLLLREMRKRTDIERFYQSCAKVFTPYLVDDVDMTIGKFLDIYFIGPDDCKLRDAVWEFLCPNPVSIAP